LTKKNDSEFVFFLKKNNQNTHAFKIKKMCHAFQQTFSKSKNVKHSNMHSSNKQRSNHHAFKYVIFIKKKIDFMH